MSFIVLDIMHSFWDGLMCPPVSPEKCAGEEKELRDHLSEPQIDKMIEDSFPASDPPSTY